MRGERDVDCLSMHEHLVLRSNGRRWGGWSLPDTTLPGSIRFDPRPRAGGDCIQLTHGYLYKKSIDCANRLHSRRQLDPYYAPGRYFFHDFKDLMAVRTYRSKAICSGFALPPFPIPNQPERPSDNQRSPKVGRGLRPYVFDPAAPFRTQKIIT